MPDPYIEEQALRKKVKDTVQNPKRIVEKVQKTMNDTLEYLTNPEKALKDPDNELAESLRVRIPYSLNQEKNPSVSEAVAKEVIKQTNYLKQAPDIVQKAFINVIVEASRPNTRRLDLNFYQIWRDIAQFMLGPIGWLSSISRELTELLSDSIIFYAQERFYESMGASRIGCHSLMAKDHGHEPFYNLQKQSSIAVHWYIVKLMLRGKEKHHLPYINWLKEEQNPSYIDWLEVLEFFTRNPLPPSESYRDIEIDVPITMNHIVKTCEQLGASGLQTDNLFLALELRYRQTTTLSPP